MHFSRNPVQRSYEEPVPPRKYCSYIFIFNLTFSAIFSSTKFSSTLYVIKNVATAHCYLINYVTIQN